MAEDSEEMFVWGDDFDAILAILEEDEAIDHHFTSVIKETQTQEIVCNKCGKKYKTRGGYERHTLAKHSQDSRGAATPFSNSLLEGTVAIAVRNVNAAEVFAENLRKELSSYVYQPLSESSDEYSFLKTLYDDFTKSGNLDKYYSKYYAKVPLRSTTFFSGLSRNAATVLSTKVADSLIAFNKKERESTNTTTTTTILNERDIAGLQYLGGYVLHKLYRKHAKANTKESQQAMAILKAGKLEESTHGATTQKLITSLNRGGLWSITMPAQRIFVKIEKHFRLLTPNINLQGINLSGITRKAITDSDILSNFDLMVADASIESGSHVRKDVLYSIVKLYVRVRAFSVSKDVIQKYKLLTKQTKTKSLRKELSMNQEEPRQD
ncbi:uncharacterized protein [Montipora foliosa]|uniref:uncharacterized protein n=1 Tax=Montipora foliosa TaxID=591990 RepID=UPI0035F13AC9